jgi:hypothetical protein
VHSIPAKRTEVISKRYRAAIGWLKLVSHSIFASSNLLSVHPELGNQEEGKKEQP